ncbi:MAG: hypothetical protein ACM3VS_00395 [Candidatus Dadabacteria bacterium]
MFKRLHLVYTLLGSLLLIIIFSSCSSSRRITGLEEGWEVLGERKVNFLNDKDVIDITNKSLYTALRFMVEDRDIRINELKIYFNNGDKLEPALDEEIPAGQSSRYIELGSEGRIIDRLEFKYRTVGNILKGRANVIVLGRRFNPYR